MHGFVYILKSQTNGQYYIGSCINVRRRLRQHNMGNVKSTRYKRPWELCFVSKLDTTGLARQTELRLKKMKSRKIIESIIQDKEIKFLHNSERSSDG